MQESLRDPAGLLERAPELAELAQADASVRAALAKGDPRGVHRALWWARLVGRLKPQRAIVDALLEHRRLFAVPFKRSPALGTMNGVGASLYGKSDSDLDGSYVKTHFLVFAFVPIFPFAQYLVRDAEEGGWYVMAKVPTSFWLRLWRGVVVAAVAAAVAVAAVRVGYSSRYHDVHVVNSLPTAVAVQIGDSRVEVPAGDRRVVTVRVGHHAVATTAAGHAIESGQIVVEAGAHVLVWNVLGAGSVFDRVVIYSSPGTTPPEDPSPRFHCGERVVRLETVDYPFRDAPPTIQMPKSQPYARRTHLNVATSNAGVCGQVLARAADPKPGLALAQDLARLGDRTSTAIAISLWRRLGKLEEAVTLARQAASAPASSVDDHRAYQDVASEHGLGVAVLEEYRTRAQASPDSADAAYLYARASPPSRKHAMSAELVARFPEHVPSLRLRLFVCVRRHEFAEAVLRLDTLRRLAPEEWAAVHVEEHAQILAALGRGDEARALLEAAFDGASEPEQYRLAALHHWLAGPSDPAKDVLVKRLTTADPGDALRFRIRFWDAPVDVALRPTLPEAEHPYHRLAIHTHYDPKVALTDVLTVPADHLSSLDGEVLLLLLGEALRTSQPKTRERLEEAVRFQDLPVGALAAYIEGSEWSEEIDALTLPLQGTLHLARSRRAEVQPRERERLRALALRCDPAGGFVSKALASWPAP